VADLVLTLPHSLLRCRGIGLSCGEGGRGDVSIRVGELFGHHHTRSLEVAFLVSVLALDGEWST
jgi:hypothetical protein